MLISLSCNKKEFKTINFINGLNVILDDCKNKGGHNDTRTRNGVGKSTIIDLIHFCLGAKFDKALFNSAVFFESCCFSLKIKIRDNLFEFTRHVDDYKRIFVNGDCSKWPVAPKIDAKSQKTYFSIRDFTFCLGILMFGLEEKSSNPTFRELISYLIRQKGGFGSPFTIFDKQSNIDIQFCNAFFLLLNLDYVKKLSDITKKEKGVAALQATIKSGILGNEYSSVGAINAEIASLSLEADALQNQLQSFEVHPQYNELSQKASDLTEQIHLLTNDMLALKNLYKFYSDSIKSETNDVSIPTIIQVYQEANTLFPASVVKKLEEIVEFHNTISNNRKLFLSKEFTRIQSDIGLIKSKIEKMSNERKEIMLILKTQKALDEYLLLQESLNDKKGKISSLKKDLETLLSWQGKKSQLKIEKEGLLIKIRQDYSDRLESISQIQNIFAENTRTLYGQRTGKLLIDIKDNGYAFDIDIQGKKSQGINYMQIFCYDLLLINLFLQRNLAMDFLVHDSTIFDGVDERQIFAALKLAYEQTASHGQQYICLMNSDKIPIDLFDGEFKEKFQKSVILRLNDSADEGKLFGVSF